METTIDCRNELVELLADIFPSDILQEAANVADQREKEDDFRDELEQKRRPL